MKKHGGNIINITAGLHWSGSALTIHANAAKAGVDALTKTLAVEWGPFKVKVNGIVPGPIEGTEGLERLSDLTTINSKEKANKAVQKKSGKEALESMAQIIPLQRVGQAKDIANAALYLSGPVSDYVTGSLLVVDGGSLLSMPNSLFNYESFIDMYAQGKL